VACIERVKAFGAKCQKGRVAALHTHASVTGDEPATQKQVTWKMRSVLSMLALCSALVALVLLVVRYTILGDDTKKWRPNVSYAAYGFAAFALLCDLWNSYARHKHAQRIQAIDPDPYWREMSDGVHVNEAGWPGER